MNQLVEEDIDLSCYVEAGAWRAAYLSITAITKTHTVVKRRGYLTNDPRRAIGDLRGVSIVCSIYVSVIH